MLAAAMLVCVAMVGDGVRSATTWLVAPPISDSASKTSWTARSRSAAAVLISTRAARTSRPVRRSFLDHAAPSSIAATARSVSCWTSPIRAAISLVARLLRSASLRTSSATTAKPLPCSPARAASMAALRARRLVCSAMSSIVSTMAPIWPDLAPSSPTRLTGRLHGFADAAHSVRGLVDGFDAVLEGHCDALGVGLHLFAGPIGSRHGRGGGLDGVVRLLDALVRLRRSGPDLRDHRGQFLGARGRVGRGPGLVRGTGRDLA
jgi:hypothetical protein